MTRLPNYNRLALTSSACAAIVLAAACGGADRPPTTTETSSAGPAQTASKVTEKPFASGGRIEMQLAGGSYSIRPGSGDSIRVALAGNVGSTTVDVSTTDTRANVLVKDTPRTNFQATVDVPRAADLVIRLAGGDLKVDAITGNKDIESNAGNVDIVTGDAKDYASVDASVQAGDINAAAFGESRSGIFPKVTWSGQGKYTLRARLIAGNLTLRKD
jgi:hypothetical protein